MTAGTCANCATPLAGRWCHACGQKVVGAEERSLRWLLGQFVGALTDLDSRFLRSLRALMFRPGVMGADWLADRRARWMSPIALFLTINVAYFFAPPLNDLNLPLADQSAQWYGAHARALVEARLSARDITLEAYATRYAEESANLAKTLIILHVPPFALLLMLLTGTRRIAFVDHFAVGLHTWAAWLVIMLLTPAALSLLVWASAIAGAPLPEAVQRPLMQVALLSLVLFQMHGVLRHAYGFRQGTALLLAPVLFLAGMLAHFAYRAVLFYVTFLLS